MALMTLYRLIKRTAAYHPRNSPLQLVIRYGADRSGGDQIAIHFGSPALPAASAGAAKLCVMDIEPRGPTAEGKSRSPGQLQTVQCSRQ